MLSIGTDIVNISRFEKSLNINKDKFLKKIFSLDEIEYCNSFPEPIIHYSGKYAAKESVKKALLSSKICNRISLSDIQILNRRDRSPYVIIKNIENVNTKITISHDGNYAIAFAIIEK